MSVSLRKATDPAPEPVIKLMTVDTPESLTVRGFASALGRAADAVEQGADEVLLYLYMGLGEFRAIGDVFTDHRGIVFTSLWAERN